MTCTMGRDEIIRRILAREGGVAQVPGESFITRWGQTPGWLEQFSLPIPTNIAEAADNYAAWLSQTRLDRVVLDTADDLADITIDFAVHAGHVPAIRLLQAALGVAVDGILGPVTETALRSADRKGLARRMLAGRLEQIGGLISQRPDRYSRYALGWLRRVGEQVTHLE